MPYFINNYRIPKPGQYTNVVRGVAESLKAIGRAGFVNVPISPPMPYAQGMGGVSTLSGLDTLDDVDSLFDSMMADDMAALAARDELSAMCERANLSVSRVLSPPWTPLEGFEAKIISRNILSSETWQNRRTFGIAAGMGRGTRLSGCWCRECVTWGSARCN